MSVSTMVIRANNMLVHMYVKVMSVNPGLVITLWFPPNLHFPFFLLPTRHYDMSRSFWPWVINSRPIFFTLNRSQIILIYPHVLLNRVDAVGMIFHFLTCTIE
jgi:hypothetical protein